MVDWLFTHNSDDYDYFSLSMENGELFSQVTLDKRYRSKGMSDDTETLEVDHVEILHKQ